MWISASRHSAKSAKWKWWILWMVGMLVAPLAATAQKQPARVFYYSPTERHDPFLNSGFLEHLRRETRKDTLLVQFATDNCPLYFTLFAAPDGTIEDVLLETRVDGAVDDKLLQLLREAPPLAEQFYNQHEVPAIYPLGLNWRKILDSPAGVLPEGNELLLPRSLSVPAFPGGDARMVSVLKPLHPRLRRALAGQPLHLDLAFSRKGALQEIHVLNLPKEAAPLAAEITKRLWAAYRQSKPTTKPLRSNGHAYASRVLVQLPLPEEPKPAAAAKPKAKASKGKPRHAKRK